VQATDDPARAARRIMTDDGFNLGVLYRGNRAPYKTGTAGATQELATLEAGFSLKEYA
jgi:2-oxoglutarate/2-oxoacid ferredoxin oxidoreductase subunit beta